MPGLSSGTPATSGGSSGGGMGLDMGGQQFASLMQPNFMQQIPGLLQQGGSQGGGQRPGEQGINSGLNIAGMIPGPQQPFVEVAAQFAPFFEHLFGR